MVMWSIICDLLNTIWGALVMKNITSLEKESTSSYVPEWLILQKHPHTGKFFTGCPYRFMYITRSPWSPNRFTICLAFSWNKAILNMTMSCLSPFSIVSRRQIKASKISFSFVLVFGTRLSDWLKSNDWVYPYCELVAMTAGHLSTNYRRGQLHSPSLTVFPAVPEYLGNEDETILE